MVGKKNVKADGNALQSKVVQHSLTNFPVQSWYLRPTLEEKGIQFKLVLNGQAKQPVAVLNPFR